MALYNNYISSQPYAYKFEEYSYLDVAHNINSGEKKRQLRSMDLMERNFLQLNIHFPHMSTWHHTDQAKLTSEQCVGVMGGVLNLWMGVTFITVIELIELCSHVLLQCGRHVERREGGSERQQKGTEGNAREGKNKLSVVGLESRYEAEYGSVKDSIYVPPVST